MNLPRSPRLIGHLDMNAFFAAVEQQGNRALRGRPMGVCAYLGKHGCILAASQEAKRLGIKTGMTIAEARERIPDMRFVQADPVKYRSVISRVFGFIHELSDQVEHYSIDEAFFDLTGWYHDELSVIQPLLRVKERIREEIGAHLTCSIGVAPTKTLAKLASDAHKPDGFTMLSHASTRSFLATRSLTDICGIGPRLKRRLYGRGIFTVLDFVNASPEAIIRLGGKPLAFLQAELNGLGCQRVIAHQDQPPKSIGHSYCVPRSANRAGQVLGIFIKLLEKAAKRLRGFEREANGLAITIGFFSDTTSPTDRFWRYRDRDHLYIHLPDPLADDMRLIERALTQLATLWDGQRELSFIAVTLTDLTCPRRDQSLFSANLLSTESRDARKSPPLTQALDRIRNKYGMQAIEFGLMTGLGDAAPDRIGFRKTDGVIVTSTQETETIPLFSLD